MDCVRGEEAGNEFWTAFDWRVNNNRHISMEWNQIRIDRSYLRRESRKGWKNNWPTLFFALRKIEKVLNSQKFCKTCHKRVLRVQEIGKIEQNLWNLLRFGFQPQQWLLFRLILSEVDSSLSVLLHLLFVFFFYTVHSHSKMNLIKGVLKPKLSHGCGWDIF